MTLRLVPRDWGPSTHPCSTRPAFLRTPLLPLAPVLRHWPPNTIIRPLSESVEGRSWCLTGHLTNPGRGWRLPRSASGAMARSFLTGWPFRTLLEHDCGASGTLADMTVHIRLNGGYEDTYDAYAGCGSCCCPLAKHSTLLIASDVMECPNCGAQEVSRDQDWRRVELKWYNPKVARGEDGSLSILRWNTSLGFYPQGAWMSWRSD